MNLSLSLLVQQPKVWFFFFLDAEEVDLQQNEKHKLALVLVLEGNVTTKQLEGELSFWLGGETKWIRAQGVNQYVIRFPNVK
jgi:hypothetical protein